MSGPDETASRSTPNSRDADETLPTQWLSPGLGSRRVNRTAMPDDQHTIGKTTCNQVGSRNQMLPDRTNMKPHQPSPEPNGRRSLSSNHPISASPTPTMQRPVSGDADKKMVAAWRRKVDDGHLQRLTGHRYSNGADVLSALQPLLATWGAHGVRWGRIVECFRHHRLLIVC